MVKQHGPHTQLTDALREELTLYAFGLLEGDEAKKVAQHVKTGCAVCSAELESITRVVAEMPSALAPVTPSPDLKSRLLDRIRREKQDAPEEVESGMFVVRGGRTGWKPTPWPGVTFKLLYCDRATNGMTSLLRIEAGARFPAHHHGGVEQSWVVEGSCRIGPVTIGAGDFAWASAGTDHGILETDEGCVLLIVGSRADEVFA